MLEIDTNHTFTDKNPITRLLLSQKETCCVQGVRCGGGASKVYPFETESLENAAGVAWGPAYRPALRVEFGADGLHC